MVPILLALTDRLPARRVYLLGTGLTTLSHLGFALLAQGFWSALVFRILGRGCSAPKPQFLDASLSQPKIARPQRFGLSRTLNK